MDERNEVDYDPEQVYLEPTIHLVFVDLVMLWADCMKELKYEY